MVSTRLPVTKPLKALQVPAAQPLQALDVQLVSDCALLQQRYCPRCIFIDPRSEARAEHAPQEAVRSRHGRRRVVCPAVSSGWPRDALYSKSRPGARAKLAARVPSCQQACQACVLAQQCMCNESVECHLARPRRLGARRCWALACQMCLRWPRSRL